LQELNSASRNIGLTMNLQKIQIISTNNSQMTFGKVTIQNVEKYVYLSHIIRLGKQNQAAEIARRVGLSWAALGRLRYILRDPNTHKP